jgi:hypothetical protein
MRRPVIEIFLAACLVIFPDTARAEWTLTTTTSVRLRASPRRSSPVKRLLPRNTSLGWKGAMAEDEGMLQVVASDAPRDTGWIAGEYLVDRTLGHGSGCGVQRWPVKTMSDSDAAAVNRTPVGATIATLRALPAPRVRPQNARANSVERTEFGVSGKIIAWGLEPDSDFHLVLADASNSSQTIVLEVPDTVCVTGATRDVRDSISTARREVLQALGSPPNGVKALPSPVSVTVTGVGFFDFGHSIGHPPNAFELHPVLSIHFGTSIAQNHLAHAHRRGRRRATS